MDLVQVKRKTRWRVAAVEVIRSTGQFVPIAPHLPKWKDNEFIRVEEIDDKNPLFRECFTKQAIRVAYERFWDFGRDSFVVVIEVEEVA